jgi:hypothetical protein
MPYRIAGIDVHKKKLAVVVADVEAEEEYQFERRWYGSNPEQLRVLAEWLIEQQVEEVVITGHPFAVSGSPEPSQMIEFVFAASPETIRNEPAESVPLRPVGNRRDLAACAFMYPDVFAFSIIRKRFLGSRCSAELFGRHEILVSALDRKHVADYFPGNG